MTTTSRRPPRTPPKAPAKRKAPARKPPKPPAEAPESTAAPTAPTSKKAASKRAASKKAASKKAASKAKSAPKAESAPKTKAAPKAKTAPKAKSALKTKAAPKAKAAPRSAPKATAEVAPRRSAQSPPRTPFILLIVGLLGGALVSLLLLNTVLAKDAFTLTRLQQSSERLEEKQQELELQIAEERSPEKIAAIAKSLGMKPNEVPVFFDTDTGRASGREIRPVPHADAAAAGAASVIGVPGTVVPGDGAAR